MKLPQITARPRVTRSVAGRLLALAVMAVAAVATPAATASAAQDDVELVSRAGGPTGAKGNDESFAPALSADGRFVAFESDASNLVPGDSNLDYDVFVRDVETSTITLVSRAAGVTGANGDSYSYDPAVSADGRFVAFTSEASNLHPDDSDTLLDVFVRDLQANTTTLVSRAAGAAGAKGNDDSLYPAVSADGRFVAFHSGATDLVPGDTNAANDVFVHDRRSGRTPPAHG
jgi:Tol biopolymer transport system component